MSISPVSSGHSQLYAPSTATAQTAADRKVDDKHKQQSEQTQSSNAKAQPTVNTNGQTTGQLINTTA
ncbi:hypothetical protein [Paludibacterium purpuratum]|uniref:Uncharacterized protein n=1 Tax=Paludibacterium purpuratum TaxID=1144873 RepID=A0A4R7B9H0_9NEIS|nr:hypothetical protein [Paludibacterium purpuratum]TDR81468.1 hypothetical protein DFP86_103121 [Paludibacterium purpuratum]